MISMRQFPDIYETIYVFCLFAYSMCLKNEKINRKMLSRVLVEKAENTVS